MTCFAAHYLFLPGHGFLKQQAIEVEGNRIRRVFPLTEEVENTLWQAGVIALLPAGSPVSTLSFSPSDVLDKLPEDVAETLEQLTPVWFTPFDLRVRKPVAETRHTQLRSL